MASVPIKAQPVSERDSAAPVVITGSRIPRTDLTAVSPVTIIKGDEFKLEGATNAEEVLNQLPQVNPSQGEFVSAGATGAATVDLRGLGSVRTLVLVNGHRLMPGDPRFPVADINSIPTSIIQRVEVLTGGAAAVYGSDAVAGVVNFILDTRLDGLKVEGEISGYQHDNRDEFAQGLLDQRQLPYPKGSVFDGRRENVSVAFGRSFFDNRAHVTLYGGYRQIDGAHAGPARLQRLPDHRQDRRSATDIHPRMRRSRSSPIRGTIFDNLGNVIPGHARPDVCARLEPIQFRALEPLPTAGQTIHRRRLRELRPFQRGSGLCRSDGDERPSVWQIGPSGDFTNTETINCDNPLLSDQQRSLICRTGNFVGEIPVFDDNGNLLLILGSPTPFVDPVTGATYSRAWLLIARRNIEGGPIQDDLTA